MPLLVAHAGLTAAVWATHRRLTARTTDLAPTLAAVRPWIGSPQRREGPVSGGRESGEQWPTNPKGEGCHRKLQRGQRPLQHPRQRQRPRVNTGVEGISGTDADADADAKEGEDWPNGSDGAGGGGGDKEEDSSASDFDHSLNSLSCKDEILELMRIPITKCRRGDQVNRALLEAKKNAKGELGLKDWEETIRRNSGLWVDKYSPKGSDDLVGNRDICEKLRDWLAKWEARHQYMEAAKKGGQKRDTANMRAAGARFKAVLLSGRPGIGKTTMAHLLPKELGYVCYELNAAQDRSKEKLERFLKDATQRQMISVDPNDLTLKKRCVVMDEVDGMHGSETSGGMKYLIETIKASHIPFICTCNWRAKDKIKGLAGHCFDLQVRPPHSKQIAERLLFIAKNEGLNLTQKAAEILAEQSRCDIRGSINMLQSLSGLQALGISIDEDLVNERSEEAKAGAMINMGPEEALQEIFLGSKSRFTFDERVSIVNLDWEPIVDLAVENYEKAIRDDDARNATEKTCALEVCKEIEKQIELYRDLIMRTNPNDVDGGHFPLTNDRPSFSARQYGYVPTLVRYVVMLGEVVGCSIDFPERPKRPLLRAQTARKENKNAKPYFLSSHLRGPLGSRCCFVS